MRVIVGEAVLRSLHRHVQVPTFWSIGTTAQSIVFADYDPTPVTSLQLWNRGSTDLYINFNGVTATGNSPTSTDMHLAGGEEWAGSVAVTSISVIAPQGNGNLEVQAWG